MVAEPPLTAQDVLDYAKELESRLLNLEVRLDALADNVGDSLRRLWDHIYSMPGGI